MAHENTTIRPDECRHADVCSDLFGSRECAARGGSSSLRPEPRAGGAITTWDEAVPLGNGLLGGLLWGEKNTIRLSLDRGDLWDERPAGEKEWWKKHTYAMGKQLVDQKKFDAINGLWDSPYNGTTPTKLPAGRMEITLDRCAAGQDVRVESGDRRRGCPVHRMARSWMRFSARQSRSRCSAFRGRSPRRFELLSPMDVFRRQNGGNAGPSSGGAVAGLGYPAAKVGSEGTAKWYVQAGSRRAGVLCLHGIPSRRQRDAGGRDGHFHQRRRRPAHPGTSTLPVGIGPRLRGDAEAARRLVAEVLDAIERQRARAGDPASLRPLPLLLRRRLPARCAADALAGRLDGRLRRTAAVEGRLSQRPQHADDVYRLSWSGKLRRGRVVSRFPLAAKARFREVCARLLRHAWTGLPRRHVAGRPAARRLGTVQPVADHERVERASVLPALAIHDG